jgi:hypothetical protein
MCISAVDNWFWRGKAKAQYNDHIRAPYFLKQNSKCLLYFRLFVAVCYTLWLIVHLMVSRVEFFFFVTNWNLALTTCTFVMLCYASFIG